MLYSNPKIRTWAEIDMAAVKHNLDIARNTGKKVMCVIKADGYGHGAVELGRYLEKNGASAFAVAYLEEAIALREGGVTLPILMLGYTPAKYAPLIAKYGLSTAVVDLEAAKALEEEAAKAGVTLPVHIKIDTGMSRLGFLCQSPDEIAESVNSICEIAKMPHLKIEAMFTHFSVADTPSEDDYTAWQLKNYLSARELLSSRGVAIPLCHTSNSAAILSHPECHFDMVREGIILYGLYPDSIHRENGPLKPVMTLKTTVAQIKEFPAGTTFSYGRTFKSDTPMRVAVIMAGYADGYPRRLSNAVTVTIRGKQYNQIGRICMDMCMIDVTGSDVERGDEVILFGNGGPSLEQISDTVGTINYELSCLVTPRIPRVYINK